MAKPIFPPRLDCFAFVDMPGRPPKCGVLTELLCITRGRCGFYATEPQMRAAQAKAAKRAARMGYIPGCYVPGAHE